MNASQAAIQPTWKRMCFCGKVDHRLHSLQGLQSLMGSKPDSAMKIDPDGKRLQIDDLIIIPNNLHSPPEGGSALKSLAQIASRYQSGPGGQPTEASSPKKPRLDSDGKVVPPAASPAHAASSLHQQGLFSVFPSGLIPGTWPPMGGGGSPSTKTSTNTTNSTNTKPTASSSSSSSSTSSAAVNSALALAAAAAAAGLSNFPLTQDPSKQGSDGYAQLLQLYEKHLKSAAAAVPAAAAAAPTPPSAIKPATVGVNGSKKEPSTTPVALSAREKDRQKVSKPPPETKRPPRLIQTPCAFVQTSHFYTNPMVELTKAKEAVAAASAAAAARDKLPMGVGTIESQLTRTTTTSILDLSAQRKHHKSEQPQPPPTGLLNLKKESSLLANPHSSAASSANVMGPAMKRENLPLSHPLGFGPPLASSPSAPKPEMKSSPFSAESLLSKSSPSAQSKASGSFSHAMSDLVKMSSDRGKQDQMSRLSPAAQLSSLPRASPAPRSSPFATSHSPLPTSQDKARTSPWHTPVSQAAGTGQKPAIPVSPVVRETDSAKNSLSSFQSALLGLSYPTTTTSSSSSSNNLMSMSSMPPTSYASLSPTASSLAAAQQSFAAAAAANPYLALMSMGGGLPPVSTSSAMSKSLASSFQPHLMDPATSAYYAALYSQQMYGLSPYLGLGAGLRPGMSSPASSQGMNQSAAASALAAAAAAGLDPLQASALQAMLGGGRGSAGSTASQNNPFPGFPTGLSGFPGYPSFPPPSGRKDS